MNQISDKIWAERLGIKCQHPDGGDNCACQHYSDPKNHPACRYAPKAASTPSTQEKSP